MKWWPLRTISAWDLCNPVTAQPALHGQAGYVVKQAEGSPSNSPPDLERSPIIYCPTCLHVPLFWLFFTHTDRTGGTKGMWFNTDDLEREIEGWNLPSLFNSINSSTDTKSHESWHPIHRNNTALPSVLGQSVTEMVWKFPEVSIVHISSAYRAGTLNCK